MRFHIDSNHAKAMATRLQTFLTNTPKSKLTRASAIEAVARMLGFNNRNDMLGRLDDGVPSVAPDLADTSDDALIDELIRRQTPLFIGVYRHRHGTDIGVHPSAADAEQARRDTAAFFWDTEMPEDTPKPDDPDVMADAYFEHMLESHPTDFEEFEIEKRTIGSRRFDNAAPDPGSLPSVTDPVNDDVFLDVAATLLNDESRPADASATTILERVATIADWRQDTLLDILNEHIAVNCPDENLADRFAEDDRDMASAELEDLLAFIDHQNANDEFLVFLLEKLSGAVSQRAAAFQRLVARGVVLRPNPNAPSFVFWQDAHGETSEMSFADPADAIQDAIRRLRTAD